MTSAYPAAFSDAERSDRMRQRLAERAGALGEQIAWASHQPAVAAVREAHQSMLSFTAGNCAWDTAAELPGLITGLLRDSTEIDAVRGRVSSKMPVVQERLEEAAKRVLRFAEYHIEEPLTEGLQAAAAAYAKLELAPMLADTACDILGRAPGAPAEDIAGTFRTSMMYGAPAQCAGTAVRASVDCVERAGRTFASSPRLLEAVDETAQDLASLLGVPDQAARLAVPIHAMARKVVEILTVRAADAVHEPVHRSVTQRMGDVIAGQMPADLVDAMTPPQRTVTKRPAVGLGG